jgi:hypothetical protein
MTETFSLVQQNLSSLLFTFYWTMMPSLSTGEGRKNCPHRGNGVMNTQPDAAGP